MTLHDPAHDATAHDSGPTDQPSDNTTLVEVIAGYRQAGFVTEFWVESDSKVRCDECQSVLDSNRLPIRSMRRLEGASDPADMAVVIATSCPVCGADGTMVLGYGPMASGEDADVMHRIKAVEAHDDRLPQHAAPDEVPDSNA